MNFIAPPRECYITKATPLKCEKKTPSATGDIYLHFELEVLSFYSIWDQFNGTFKLLHIQSIPITSESALVEIKTISKFCM